MQLQRKLFLVLSVLTISPLLVLQFGVVDRNESVVEERVREEVLSALDKLAGELETLLNAQRAMVRGLATVPSVERFAAAIRGKGEDEAYRQRVVELQNFFLNYQAAVPSIQAMRAMDDKGNTLVKVKEGKVVLPGIRLADGRGFVANHASKRFFEHVALGLVPGSVGLSDFELGQVTPDAAFCPSMLRYITPLADAGGRTGFLVVNVWGSRIDEVVARTLAGQGGKIMMTDLDPSNPARDGVYLYHDDPRRRFADQRGGDFRLSRELGESNWRLITHGPNRGSVQLGPRMFFYHKFTAYDANDTQWLLVAAKDRHEFLGPVIEMRETIWALVGFVSLLCLVLARWSAIRMARPVRELSEIITRYANGERIRYTERRRDEIGRVGRAYNYLIDTLDKAERDRERAEAIACQAAKMATVGELAAGVAHEINNPLNNMMGLTELMERGVERDADPQSLREDLEVLRQEQRRCADIVQGLLDFGRPRAPTLQAVDLGHLVSESMRLLAKKARTAGVTMELERDPAVPGVEGDAGQLQQVIVNVLLNAIQASGSGSHIQVRLELAPGDQVSLRVEDAGQGLDEALLPRIFEPFYTTKQGRNGTGLGLSVSYSIIQRHGGEMGARRRRGGGLEVWLSLPRRHREAGAPRPGVLPAEVDDPIGA
jgi:two-component system NtrC family sensor kinase